MSQAPAVIDTATDAFDILTQAEFQEYTSPCHKIVFLIREIWLDDW
ncbi:MAG: hypothetical protein QJT81_21595 [Candidatus Thiothrix putei]|uniref:Uncharacterized protein n=1 Tax=Candidatus Thiothrix putei TaxID=3080811 RepID=A0AA95HFX7_9GAMM|nr:MAG: hypothetical protein QJT81_21595 [Candidatus Thiothrix putei]